MYCTQLRKAHQRLNKHISMGWCRQMAGQQPPLDCGTVGLCAGMPVALSVNCRFFTPIADQRCEIPWQGAAAVAAAPRSNVQLRDAAAAAAARRGGWWIHIWRCPSAGFTHLLSNLLVDPSRKPWK